MFRIYYVQSNLSNDLRESTPNTGPRTDKFYNKYTIQEGHVD